MEGNHGYKLGGSLPNTSIFTFSLPLSTTDWTYTIGYCIVRSGALSHHVAANCCRLSISWRTLLCTFRKVLRILFQSGIWVLDLELFGIWGTISSDMIYRDWWRPWLERSSGEIKLAAERFWPQDCDCKLVSLSRVKSIILNWWVFGLNRLLLMYTYDGPFPILSSDSGYLIPVKFRTVSTLSYSGESYEWEKSVYQLWNCSSSSSTSCNLSFSTLTDIQQAIMSAAVLSVLPKWEISSLWGRLTNILTIALS